ncbi:hypothetical protein LTR56_024279 [Elasticomyces elasticus]|nr:hypothetical protein LTR56_024279 [Elasticomyces elasticus]KAK4905903.1 hypothetical protein LTR49_024873 [Elasticomyces elasticus]
MHGRTRQQQFPRVQQPPLYEDENVTIIIDQSGRKRTHLPIYATPGGFIHIPRIEVVVEHDNVTSQHAAQQVIFDLIWLTSPHLLREIDLVSCNLELSALQWIQSMHPLLTSIKLGTILTREVPGPIVRPDCLHLQPRTETDLHVYNRVFQDWRPLLDLAIDTGYMGGGTAEDVALDQLFCCLSATGQKPLQLRRLALTESRYPPPTQACWLDGRVIRSIKALKIKNFAAPFKILGRLARAPECPLHNLDELVIWSHTHELVDVTSMEMLSLPPYLRSVSLLPKHYFTYTTTNVFRAEPSHQTACPGIQH